jgi:hypothetical protein
LVDGSHYYSYDYFLFYSEGFRHSKSIYKYSLNCYKFLCIIFDAVSQSELRSGFAAYDIVVIILWVMAAMNDLSYLPMIACFAMFFVNDIYGFINWIRIKNRQQLQFHSSVELKN